MSETDEPEVLVDPRADLPPLNASRWEEVKAVVEDLQEKFRKAKRGLHPTVTITVSIACGYCPIKSAGSPGEVITAMGQHLRQAHGLDLEDV